MTTTMAAPTAAKPPLPPAGARVPFAASSQLCFDLILTQDAAGKASVDAAKQCRSQHLPGQPFVPLQATAIAEYLAQELLTPRLNRMAPYMWLLATPRSSHVTALHAQGVRGRTVTVTENPELHLVWMDGRVFVKPMAPFLMSHAFWEAFLTPSTDSQPLDEPTKQLAGAALGFMRTYYFLIKHESDFRLAKDAGLLPAKMRWTSFARFIRQFGDVDDAQVSPRYRFGELRMTRLNLWAPVFLHEWQFQKISWQYGEYFARLYGPALFVFAVFSVILSAMQVGAQVRPEWTTLFSVSAWFAVVTMALVALVLCWLLVILIVMVGREIVFALRHQFKKSRARRRSRE